MGVLQIFFDESGCLVRKTRKRVALLIESSRAYGRGLLVGVAKFAQMSSAWITTQHPERLLDHGIPKWFYEKSFDGVIIRTGRKDILDEITSLGIPVVDLRAAHPSSAYVVETDDRQVSRLAVDHLIAKGHSRFGFCGYAFANYSSRRLNYFKEYLQAKGFEPFVYEARLASASRTIARIEAAAVQVEQPLVQWLSELPKPIGLMACNDIRGNQVLEACMQQGIAVPDEVAVVGVDNDEVICNLASPPLSSIQNNTEMIGCYAAELLNRLMEGITGNESLSLVSPKGVVARRSSDSAIVADKGVARALAYIRENACAGIDVSDVVNELPFSRATLERRFRKVMHRSIHDEIKRVKIVKVKKLLLETDMKLRSIARLAGFEHAEYLSTLFKREFGITPGQFRKENRL